MARTTSRKTPTVTVTMRLPPEVMEAFEKLREAKNLTQTAMFTELVNAAKIRRR